MDAGDLLDDPVVFLWFLHRPADVGSRSPSVKGAHKTDPGTNTGPQSKVSEMITHWFQSSSAGKKWESKLEVKKYLQIEK